tara:strand:+ start:81 stop:497 length:417 start_codon:yes stop_codon:yes gene_type:complete
MEAQKELATDTSQPVKRGRGRPRKENRLMTRLQWEDQKKQVAGRPKGMRTAIKKLEERLLDANRIDLVIDSIVRAACDDENKNQAAAWKLIMDRMAPMSHYDKNKLGDRPMININVTTAGDTSIKQVGEVYDSDEDLE